MTSSALSGITPLPPEATVRQCGECWKERGPENCCSARPGCGASLAVAGRGPPRARPALAPGRRTPARAPTSGGQRASWRERSVAAATAAVMATRTPRSSSTRRPASVVPPGEVTASRRLSGVSPDSTRSRAAPARVSVARSAAHLGGQPHRHARLDEGLDHQEHVGRPRARQPGHGVERRLGQPDDVADRGEELLGPGQVGLGRPRPRPRWRRPRPPPSPGCWAWPAPPPSDGASHDSSRARGTPAMIDRTRPIPTPTSARHASSPTAGLTATTAAGRGGDLRTDLDARELDRRAPPGVRRTARRRRCRSGSTRHREARAPARSPMRPPPTTSNRRLHRRSRY